MGVACFLVLELARGRGEGLEVELGPWGVRVRPFARSSIGRRIRGHSFGMGSERLGRGVGDV